MLTPHVLAVGKELLRGETPAAWQRLWEGPDDCMHWLRAVVSKFFAIGALMDAPDAAALLKKKIDLSDFVRPDVFLNALRQLSSRALK